MRILWIFTILLSLNLRADELIDSYNHEAKREYAKALELVEKLTKDNPNDYFFWIRAGWLAYLKGDFSKSNVNYQKATILSPNAIEPRLGQIKALLALGNYKQADMTARAVLKLDSKNYYARTSIAFGNYSTGNFKEAEKFYDSLVADYPADFEMWIGLGWTYLKLGKKDVAKKTFERLIKILPADERVTSGLYYASN